jgi:hypothetical protein
MPVVRFPLLLVLGLGVVAAALACGPAYDRPHGDGIANEVVFGIEQNAQGVSADYDFIGLGGHGGSLAAAFRDGDGEGSCWYEILDNRLGKPHVDNGTARWTGGTLGSIPGEGLLVLANQPQPTKQSTVGWTSADSISFYAEGFAMPPLERVTMRAPLVELTVGAIAPAPDATTGTMTITPKTDVGVSWTPPAEDTLSRILVTLETEHANVRCFTRPEKGSSIVPAQWIERLFPDPRDPSDGGSSSITGKLTIASHRQTTLIEPGNWLVYVVATSVHRQIAFTGTRE